MAKIDPKLLKKIPQSELIQASKIIGIPNAEKVSKEILISAFTKKVEEIPEADQPNLDEAVIKMYNHIVTVLGEVEDHKGEGGEVVEEKTETKKEGGEKKMAKKEAVAGKKAPAPKKEKDNGRKYTRAESIVLALKKKKSGTAQEYAEIADKIYVDGGGQAGPEASVWLVRTLFEGFVLIGSVKRDGKTFSLAA